MIITTNFDRLMEMALQEVGVQPQVISRPEAVTGMKPLPHAPATIIKLHGDYKDLNSLNTPQELGSYPDQWRDLLERVFDDYGLIVVGWSATWDAALVSAIGASPTRRYPLYWDARSSRGDVANELLRNRDGHAIPAASADELLADLESSVEALTSLAEAPISTEIAVARTKRFLHNPLRRVDLFDLVMANTEPVRDVVEARGPGPSTQDGYELALDQYRSASDPLIRILAG